MIFKQTLAALYVFLSISVIYANNDTLPQKDTSIVRLLSQLKEVGEDTNKVKILKDLSLNLLNSSPEESRKRANQTIELSQKLNYPSGIAAGLNVLALNEEHNGNYTKTIEYYLKSLKILEKIHDRINVANVLSNLGTAYKFQQDYQLALKYLMDGLNIFKDDLYPELNCYEVKVDSTITDISNFAEKFGTNYKILKLLNPWLRKPFLTPKPNKQYVIKIPSEGMRTNEKIETVNDLLTGKNYDE